MATMSVDDPAGSYPGLPTGLTGQPGKETQLVFGMKALNDVARGEKDCQGYGLCPVATTVSVAYLRATNELPAAEALERYTLAQWEARPGRAWRPTTLDGQRVRS